MALAAIQGLNQKLEQKEAEIAHLKRDVRELRKVVAEIKEKLRN